MFPLTVLFRSVSVAAKLPNAPPRIPKLLLNVLFRTVASAATAGSLRNELIAPPLLPAVLPMKLQLSTVRVPKLLIPPPDEFDWFPLIAQRCSVSAFVL